MWPKQYQPIWAWCTESPCLCITETHPHQLQNQLQGCYTFRHNQVLRQLAIILERRGTTTKALFPHVPKQPSTISYVTASRKNIGKSGNSPPGHSRRLENES